MTFIICLLPIVTSSFSTGITSSTWEEGTKVRTDATYTDVAVDNSGNLYMVLTTKTDVNFANQLKVYKQNAGENTVTEAENGQGTSRQEVLERVSNRIKQVIHKYRWLLLTTGIVLLFLPQVVSLRDLLFFQLILFRTDLALMTTGAILIGLAFPGGMKGKILLILVIASLFVLNYFVAFPVFDFGNGKVPDLNDFFREAGLFLLSGAGITIIINRN